MGSFLRSALPTKFCSPQTTLRSILLHSFLLIAALICIPSASYAQSAHRLELSRPVRSWEFLCAVGQKSAIFGNESGEVEAWVYPLKVFRDFSLVFHVDGRSIPAAVLARTVIARPESTAILYAGDTFQVTETFLTPVQEAGIIIRLDVQTEHPLEIEAIFRRDFQLEWPAGLAATFSSWEPPNRAFVFGEESQKFAALVGSPTGVVSREEIDTNYASSSWSGIRLGTTAKGNETKLVLITASTNGFAEAETTYKKLAEKHEQLEQDSARYYNDYLARTVNVDVPDEEIQRAYDWSRVSVIQGLVTNPKFGTGLIAGYRTSGDSQRPGFAWFFGRDSLWTSLALNTEGDFPTTKTALEFLTQFQREDGRIPHEIAQTANLVDWFKAYPFAFASADATPLYIIAIEDYVRSSGDIQFARDHWNNAWKSYEFLRSTYGPNGLPRNFAIGHGWVEGGPLLPVQSELYQSGLSAEAIRSLASLAKLIGRDDDANKLTQEFCQQKAKVNDVFWLEEKQYYPFAIGQNNKIVPEATVLSTVPMWFNLLDPARSRKTITHIASLDHSTDWGMRIISDKSPLYSAEGYHFGSVWPLFTGWASVGEYNYHQAQPALENLRANALLANDGSLGHVTEVLSGTYYGSLSTASPHQIWSAAMVISPLLKGLFGLKADALTHTLKLAPTLPANWNSFSLKNVRVASATVDIAFHRTKQEMTLELQRSGEGDLFFEYEPALSLRAQVLSVTLNGKPIPFTVQPNDTDQHLQVRFPLGAGANILRVQLRHDFAISYISHLPAQGARSEGLRILSEDWSSSKDLLTLQLEGIREKSYELFLFDGEEVSSVDGGMLVKSAGRPERISLSLPAGDGISVGQTLVLHFAPLSNRKH